MKLNNLEAAILNEVIQFHIAELPELTNQIPNLSVIDRQLTGVGVYVNFGLENQVELYSSSIGNKEVLGSPTSIFLNTLENEISYELSLTSTGKFKFLEIVSNNNEMWSGKYDTFEIKR